MSESKLFTQTKSDLTQETAKSEQTASNLETTDKQLLRGRVGYLHSWVLQGNETSQFENGVGVLDKLPKVVFVKFQDAEWTLPGLVWLDPHGPC